jgi:radical SAM protein with 4Fe4S-binding SPASM domain
MLCFHESTRITEHGEVSILYNLQKNYFIKVQKKSLDFLKKYIDSNGSCNNLLKNLPEDDYNKFDSFLKYLKEKNYIIDKTSPVRQDKKNLKQEFLQQKRSAYYEVTHKCNLKCRFCYANPNFSPVKIEGDVELSKKIIDKAKELNIDELIISGGEPLLRKDIFEIIEYAKKRMRNVVLLTNGVLIDPQTARKLKDTNLDRISISVESSYKEIHNDLRGEGTFEKTLSAIQRLKDAGFDRKSLNIVATITQKNIHTLHQFPKFADDLGVSMNFSEFQPVGRGEINAELAITKKQFLKLILQTGEYLPEPKKETETEEKKKEGNCGEANNGPRLVTFLKTDCGIVKKSLAIRCNGDLIPCHIFFPDKNPDIVIGNILDESTADKLWDFYLTKIPTVDEKESCRNCNVRYFCGGLCFGVGYFKDRTFYTSHPFCKRMKEYYAALVDALGSENEVKTLRSQILKALEH